MDDELFNNDFNTGDDTFSSSLDSTFSGDDNTSFNIGSLDVDISSLTDKVDGLNREENEDNEDWDSSRKMCPTRHGCQGATDCDYCGGDYPG